MTRSTLLTISIAAFLISFGLPAYYDERGYQCAWASLTLMATLPDGGVWLYYFAFNLTNLFMVVVPLTCILKASCRPPVWLRIAQILLVLHVLSWPVTNLLSDELAKVQVGYYVWLFSMLCALVGVQKER